MAHSVGGAANGKWQMAGRWGQSGQHQAQVESQAYRPLLPEDTYACLEPGFDLLHRRDVGGRLLHLGVLLDGVVFRVHGLKT